MQGVFPAVFARLAQKPGLRCEFLPAGGREEYFALREDGSADIIPDLPAGCFTAPGPLRRTSC